MQVIRQEVYTKIILAFTIMRTGNFPKVPATWPTFYLKDFFADIIHFCVNFKNRNEFCHSRRSEGEGKDGEE